jgi:SMC interacting uncharacterized protein involved in chromosome segregation
MDFRKTLAITSATLSMWLVVACSPTVSELPPKAVIVPVTTENLQKETKVLRKNIDSVGEAGRKTSESVDRATLTATDLRIAVEKALNGADAEVNFLVARLESDLAGAKREAASLRKQYDELKRQFEGKVSAEVDAVVKDAATNSEQIKSADKVDDQLRAKAVKGIKAEKDLIVEESRKKGWRLAALIGWGLIVISAVVRFFGAAVVTFVRANNPFSK